MGTLQFYDWLIDGTINMALYAIITVSMDWTSRCFTWIYSTVLQTTLQCWHRNWRWLWLWWRSAKSCITQFWASYCYRADTDTLYKYDLCAIIMQHFLLPHRWSDCLVFLQSQKLLIETDCLTNCLRNWHCWSWMALINIKGDYGFLISVSAD